MKHFVVRLWLADRPGALGEVASAIGHAGGDVESVDILEREGGQAIDEFVVALPDGVAPEDLVTHLRRVGGVAIEDVRLVSSGGADTSLRALQVASELVTAPADQLIQRCHRSISELFECDWSAVISLTNGYPLSSRGNAPDPDWLQAFLAGSQHLDIGSDQAQAPRDIVWAELPVARLAVSAGRADRPFHSRERQLVQLLAHVVDGLLTGTQAPAATDRQ